MLDLHYSLTRNIEFINLVRLHYAIMICLPPYSSHLMMLFDVGFMSSLKTY